MQTFLILGGVFGFLAVALGAFGAHALRDKVPADKLSVFQTGVQYQMYHALALLAVGVFGIVKANSLTLDWAGWLMTVGIILFSGSLYVLTGTRSRAVGIITPFGGVALLAGWAMFVIAVVHT